jgi:hypothetical protein
VIKKEKKSPTAHGKCCAEKFKEFKIFNQTQRNSF